MSVLAVGLSHRSAPLPVLERTALDAASARALETTLCSADHVAEAVVLTTCNRLEVYAEVSKFHGGVADVGHAVCRATGLELAELTDHLYVHYEDAAVEHLFNVACGLDSMALGEQQILGQVREALRGAQAGGAVGRVLDNLLQQALRVGKRAHSETALDRAGHSLVQAGLQEAARIVGPLARRRVLVVGAGAMSGLAVAIAHRLGAASVAVANRTPERAERLAATVSGTPVDLGRLAEAIAAADVVVSGTGSVGFVVDAATVAVARQAREHLAGVPQVFVDLALPRDVEPAVAAIDGVHLIDLEGLGHLLSARGRAVDVSDVRAIVAEEVSGYLARQRAEAVAPTVVALRAHARAVVESELARLDARLAGVDDAVRAEVAQAVHRVVEKLLHTPTVRVKELAGGPGGGSYADALRELFDLAPERVEEVSGVPLETVRGAR